MQNFLFFVNKHDVKWIERPLSYVSVWGLLQPEGKQQLSFISPEIWLVHPKPQPFLPIKCLPGLPVLVQYPVFQQIFLHYLCPSPKLNLLSLFCRYTTLLVTSGSQTLVRSKELPGAYYKVQIKILLEKKRIQSNTFGQGSFMSHQPSPPTVEVFIWDLNTVHQVSISCGVYASTDLVVALQWAVRTCEWVPNLYSFETTPCQAWCRSVVFKPAYILISSGKLLAHIPMLWPHSDNSIRICTVGSNAP